MGPGQSPRAGPLRVHRSLLPVDVYDEPENEDLPAANDIKEVYDTTESGPMVINFGLFKIVITGITQVTLVGPMREIAQV